MSNVKRYGIVVVVIIVLMIFGASVTQSALLRNRHSLNVFRNVLPLSQMIWFEWEQGRVESARINQLKSEVGAVVTARWLLRGAALQWETRKPETLELLLDEIVQRGWIDSLDSAQRLQAAFFLTDITLAQPSWNIEARLIRLDKALAFASDYPDALALKGIYIAQSGQWESGRALLLDALAIAKERKNVGLIHIGKYYQSEKTDPARAGEAWIWMRMGQFQANVGQLQDAEQSLLHSLNLHSENAWGLDAMAGVLIRQGYCSEAIPYARLAVSGGKNAANFRLHLADAYWCAGSKSEAREIYRGIVSENPGYLDALRERLR
jgi:tetratricopeptide (TPR) repeat protein